MKRVGPNNRLLCITALLWATAAYAQHGPSAATEVVANDSDQQLKSLSLEQLGKVKVTTVSKQPEEIWQTAAAVTVLTEDDIRRTGATSIPELLRLVPGLEVARSQGTGWAVGIRGFNSGFSKDLLVMIDGRSVYTPLFEGVYWDVQDLPMNTIERIEIVRGPGGTIWGPNAVNGVINIITKNAADTQGAMANLRGGGAVERFSGSAGYGLAIGGSKLRFWAKGFNRGEEQDPNNDPYDHAHQERGGARWDWKPTVKDALTAQGTLYRGGTGDQNTIGQFTPPAQIVVDGEQKVSGGDLVLRWDHQQRSGSSFYAETYYDRTYRNTSQFAETRNTFDLDLTEHVASWKHQELTFGAQIRESPSAIDQTQSTVDFQPHKLNNFLYSLFAQDALKLIADKLTLTLGSKLLDDVYSDWGVEPSASLLYHPWTNTTFWGSVARALRTPGRLDSDLSLYGYAGNLGAPLGPTFLEVTGNPNFQPEVEIGWNAGARQLLWKKLFVDVAAFHSDYDNVESYGGPASGLTFANPPSNPNSLLIVQFGNGLRGVTDGIELAPDWKPLPWLELKGSYSHLHLNLHSKVGYQQEAYAQTDEGSSPHRHASAQAIIDFPHGFELVPDYRFVSRLPGQNVKAYQTADLHASYRVREHLEASATGRNLLQPRHAEFGGDNGNTAEVKREVYAGLGWLW